MAQEPYNPPEDPKWPERLLNMVHPTHQPKKDGLKDDFASNEFWKDPNREHKQGLPLPLEENSKDDPHKWAVDDKETTCRYKERLKSRNDVVHPIDSRHAMSPNTDNIIIITQTTKRHLSPILNSRQLIIRK